MKFAILSIACVAALSASSAMAAGDAALEAPIHTFIDDFNKGDAAGAAASQLDTETALRRWRRREMLRIAWRDIVGTAAVTETLQAVSDLADACIRAAGAAAELHLQPIFGRPFSSNPTQESFVILGMGKLGGRELNFSSDIDLVFLFSQAGRPMVHARWKTRSISIASGANSSGCSM